MCFLRGGNFGNIIVQQNIAAVHCDGSAAAGNSNAMNADLKELYAKYHDQGFEIYQVAIDTSKAAWINVIQEQKLPWISVCDLKGDASPVIGEYNIRKLPANYIIDRKGQIVGKDLIGKDLEAEVKLQALMLFWLAILPQMLWQDMRLHCPLRSI